MSKKTLTLLGFAAKAGKLSFGMNAAVTAIKQNKAKLILVCCDVSEKSQKEMNFYKEKNNLALKVLGDDMQTVSKAVGRQCGIITVNDLQFANSISQEETE